MQIDRVVEKVGVARGTFYFHFPSKEHVLLEVQRRQEASIVERFGAAFRERPGSVRDFLLSVVEAMISQAQTIGEPELGREVLAMYVRQPRVVDVSSYPLVVAIVDYFAEAAERGEVRSDIPPEEITRIILTSLFGSIITAADDFEERLQGFRSWIDVFVRGISP
jgi:AcrR family transcriptional regulator